MITEFNVTLESSSKELIYSTLSINTHGVSSKTLMLKAMPEGLELLSTAFVTVASGVSADLLARWIYDKVKKNSHEKTVINGNQINAESVTVNQITQIINCSGDRGENKNKTKRSKNKHHKRNSKKAT